MRIFVKDLGGGHGEAWIEDWLPNAKDFTMVCYSKLILSPNHCMIDTIDTPPKYRNKGYATALVKELQKYFTKVEPIGVLPSSVGFWAKLGMEDGLGPER